MSLAFRTGARTATLAAAATVLAAGCTVGPDFTRPTPPAGGYAAPPAATGARQYEAGATVADDWYTLFRSPALDALVRAALAANPDLEGARHGLLAAQYELAAVAGSELPQLDATGGIGRGHINGSFLYKPVDAFSATGNRFGLGPALAYNLDIFGGTRRAVESQRAATAVVRDQVLNTYVTLVDQTVLTAFDYAATLARIEVTESLIHDLDAQYQLTRALEDAGKITRNDTLQSLAQLENLRATLPAPHQQRDSYRNALAQLTGTPPDRYAAPQLSLRDFVLPTALPLTLPAELVRQRPDVLAAEDSLHEASAAIGVATAARLPSLTLSGSYAQQTTALNQFFSSAGGVWSFGLNATAPLFHGGTLSAREREARERYAQASAAWRSTVIGAYVEVANALQALGHDAESYDAHARALAAARADRDLARAQYQAGKYSELQVLTAEQQYQQAALTQVAADAQRFTDTAALFRALGGGWWNAPQDPGALAARNAAEGASHE